MLVTNSTPHLNSSNVLNSFLTPGRGLHVMHSKHVMHGDLCPKNIVTWRGGDGILHSKLSGFHAATTEFPYDGPMIFDPDISCTVPLSYLSQTKIISPLQIELRSYLGCPVVRSSTITGPIFFHLGVSPIFWCSVAMPPTRVRSVLPFHER